MVNPSVAVLVMVTFLQTGPTNLLTNGDARQGSAGWTTEVVVHGFAKTEIIGGVPCFTVRSPGSFRQVVELPPSAAGRYAAIVGRGQAERVNADGSIDRPTVFVWHGDLGGGSLTFSRLLAGQQMRARPTYPGEWVAMSGVFRVPQGAAAISVWLRQAERKDDPQDGSAARFADVRMVLFPSEDAARGTSPCTDSSDTSPPSSTSDPTQRELALVPEQARFLRAPAFTTRLMSVALRRGRH